MLSLIHSENLMVIFLSFSSVPIAIIFAVDPIIVKLPPKQAPNRSAHQRISRKGSIAIKSFITGIDAATTTTLSRKLETIPLPKKTRPVRAPWLSPTVSVSLFATTCVAPVFANMPDCANKNIKKSMVHHSTPFST